MKTLNSFLLRRDGIPADLHGELVLRTVLENKIFERVDFDAHDVRETGGVAAQVVFQRVHEHEQMNHLKRF